MAKNRIGAAWDRSFEQGKKQYISGSLELGALGDLPFAIFPNDQRDDERQQPTHNIVVSVLDPQQQGERRRIYLGAAWERVAKDSEQRYLFVKLELAKLGNSVMSGVDFSRHEDVVFARLVRVPKQSEQSPDYALFHADAPAAGGGVQAEAEAESADQAQTAAQ